MFLGVPSTRVIDFNRDPAAYFGGLFFKHLVSHEIGHALGLPHLHQSPSLTRRLFLDSATEIRKILHDELKLDVDESFVQDELFARFEDTKANPYSEWPRADGPKENEGEPEVIERWAAGSVMMGPPVQSIYRARQVLGNVHEHASPQAVDRHWVSELYPRL
jgi:hypothetical protein